MANLKSQDVMTVSATIIAGLLILFTLQSISANPILTKLIEIQSDLDKDQITLGSDIQTIGFLKSEISQTKDNQTRSHIQNQIEDLQLQSFQLQSQIDSIKNEHSNWDNLGNQLLIMQNIQIIRATILGMIIPFGLAIMAEVVASSRRGNDPLDETATNMGKNILYYGIIVLIIGSAIIMSKLT